MYNRVFGAAETRARGFRKTERRSPSFDEADVSDKPGWVRDNPPLGPDQVAYMEGLNRDRLRSMLDESRVVPLVTGDPYQLDNIYESAPDGLIRRLEAELDALRQCEAEQCRAAETG